MASNQSSLPLADPATPPFEGYEDEVAPDSFDKSNHSDTLIVAETEPEVNSAKKIMMKSKSISKKIKSNADAKSEKKSSSLAAAKEKRPREEAEKEGVSLGNRICSVSKKIKRDQKAVKETMHDKTGDQHEANDAGHSAEKQEIRKKMKKKKKKNMVSTTTDDRDLDHDHGHGHTRNDISANGDTNINGGGGEKKRSNDINIGDHGGHNLELEGEKEDWKFVCVKDECKAYLQSKCVDWRWLRDEDLNNLANELAKVRAAEAAYLLLQADLDSELHRVAVDNYSYVQSLNHGKDKS